MKRDLDLVRAILQDVEATSPGQMIGGFNYDGHDVLTINEHVSLLIDAGLIEGTCIRAPQGVIRVAVRGLTWAGHDFIAAAKNDTVWAKTKAYIVSQGLPMTLDIAKTVLLGMAQQKLRDMGLSQ